MDHGVLLKELYDRIVGVPDYANITGTNLGGNEPDPTMVQLTPPACWVMFVGDQRVEEGERQVSGPAVMEFWFHAFIYLPMSKQDDHIQIHLPLLWKVSAAVNGKDSTSNTGHRWAYRGQKLALVNTNRLVYCQRYSITGSM